jgi:gas vesicle protein
VFREKRRCYFVAGLLSGVTLGAVGVLLFTPLSGWQTCGLLSEKAQGLEHKAEEVAPAMQRDLRSCHQGVSFTRSHYSPTSAFRKRLVHG